MNRFITVGIVLAAGFLAACSMLEPSDPDPLTTLVVLDDASVSAVGSFPVSRLLYARAIRKAREMGARGLALKFFIEDPKPTQDKVLANSFLAMPVLMQLSPGPDPFAVPPKAVRRNWDLRDTPEPLELTGVVPTFLPLTANAEGIGFVNARADDLAGKVEIAGRIREQPISSLQHA